MTEVACVGCGACVTGRSRLVCRLAFERKEAVVVGALNCMVGCTTRANTCPTDAIAFPSRDTVFSLEVRAEVRHAVETGGFDNEGFRTDAQRWTGTGARRADALRSRRNGRADFPRTRDRWPVRRYASLRRPFRLTLHPHALHHGRWCRPTSTAASRVGSRKRWLPTWLPAARIHPAWRDPAERFALPLTACRVSSSAIVSARSRRRPEGSLPDYRPSWSVAFLH